MNLSNEFMFQWRRYWWIIPLLLALSLVGHAVAADQQSVAVEPAAVQQSFFNLNGTLDPGESISPSYPIFNGTRSFNFSLAISGSPVMLTIENGSGQEVWDGSALAGETVWGTGVLTTGSNQITLENTGANQADYNLVLYDLPDAPYTWSGVADAAGRNSQARVTFPQAGLYTFDFSGGNGQYQFTLEDDYLAKTVVANTSVTYFVPAGTHELTIFQDTTAGADWEVAISAVGSGADALPYEKSGTLLTEEWLPIHLDAAASLNLALTATGTAGDQLQLTVDDSSPVVNTVVLDLTTVYAGETVWATVDLPAGTSRIHLVSAGGDPLGYELAFSAVPSPDYTWSGVSDAAGLNSTIRLDFPDDGLYTFDLGVSDGRYQFQLDDDYLLKTAEQTESVTYYVPAGTQELTVLQQDVAPGADWTIDISAAATGDDTLPYAKQGRMGEGFNTEWLPISLGEVTPVNMVFTMTGGATDMMDIAIYNDASGVTATYTLEDVLGTETVWTNFELDAGVNRIQLQSDPGNSGRVDYAFDLLPVPDASSATWEGHVLSGGNNSRVMLDFPEDGLYRFEMDAPQGYANLLLAEDAMNALAPLTASSTSYDIVVTAGLHEVAVIHDTAFAETTWTASVTAVEAEASFFDLAATLDPGETIMPTFPAAGGRDFNFALTSSGGQADLILEDASDTEIWNGSALDGETVWGTGALTAGNNDVILTNNGGAAINVTLVFYDLPTAPYVWDGNADAAGMNSHIRVDFPADGLYTFDYGVDSGRYQFALDAGYIQKTAEISGAVTYFVPAGVHDLYIEQDTAAGADWDLSISDAGDPADSLPFTKTGGELGGAANDFTEAWIPINLDAAQAVNVALTLSGSAGDQMEMAVGGETVSVYAGETTWTSLELQAGTSLIQLSADPGNADSLSYELLVDALFAAGDSLSGDAVAAGTNSTARMTFPQDGLYTFDLDAAGGRYQFQLNDDYILKTVEGGTTVTYFVPAGAHQLSVIQDSTAGADWTVGVSTPGAAADSLPYHKMGGDLGGTGNDFAEEWVPINPGAGLEVNLAISLTGSLPDSLQLDVVGMDDSTLETLNMVYGQEKVWATFRLPDNGARLHLTAAGANTDPLAYEVSVEALPQITGINQNQHEWGGVARDAGLNSTIRVNTTISGVYHVMVDTPLDGFVSLSIDQPATQHSQAPAAPQAFYEYDIPLASGEHTFRVEQDNTLLTTWIVTFTLQSADPPSITAVSPVSVAQSIDTTITLTGTNFMPGANVAISGTEMVTLTDVTVLSGNEATAVVPAGTAVGTYDVTLTNPDGQSATLPDGLQVYTPLPPSLTAVSPISVSQEVSTTITLTGADFLPGASVSLSGPENVNLSNVNVVSSEEATAVVPAGVAVGTYDVTITNPDDQSDTLPDALQVYGMVTPSTDVFLPLVMR